MYLTDTAEKAFLNVFRGITFNGLTSPYLSVLLNNPSEGGQGVEASYTGYRRMPLTFRVPAQDDIRKTLSIKLAQQINFPISDINAGTLTHIGIYNSANTGSGDMWTYGTLKEGGITIEIDERPVILQNELVYWLTGTISNAYKEKLLNVFTGQSILGITPYLSLWNGDPEDGGAELTGDNYERVELTFSAPTESLSEQMVVEQTVNTMFNRPNTAWGMATYLVIMDSKTGGLPAWKTPYEKDIKRHVLPMIDAGAIKLVVN